MFRQAVVASLASVFIVGAITGALAQAPAAPTPAAAGTVDTVAGQAIVVRGSQTFTLKAGDQLFPGDRVLTRTDGALVIRNATCTKTLTSAQSIVVDATVCAKTPIALGPNEFNQAAAAAGGGIGATPAVLGLLALGGGGAAAAAGGGSSSSP